MWFLCASFILPFFPFLFLVVSTYVGFMPASLWYFFTFKSSHSFTTSYLLDSSLWKGWGIRSIMLILSQFFSKTSARRQFCTLLSGMCPFILSYNGAMYWKFMFINFTLPVLNTNYKITHHLSLFAILLTY